MIWKIFLENIIWNRDINRKFSVLICAYFWAGWSVVCINCFCIDRWDQCHQLKCIGILISFYLASIIGLIVYAILFAVSLYFGHRIEKIKSQYDVQTYREIVAFIKGETLDEITKIRESGKRTYQKVLLVAASAAFGFILSLLIAWILPAIRGPWGG